MPKDVILTLGAGAGGGVVSWAFTLMNDGKFIVNDWAALPLCIILGIAAALVAVYVITPTDVTKTGKLIGFAVFCGFLWKPVLDAARVVFSEHVQAAQTTTEVKKQVGELRSAAARTASVPTTASEVVGDKAQDTAAQVATLLRTSDHLSSAKVDEAATTQATDAVSAIAQTATANPEAATRALEVIREAAVEADQEGVAKFAASSMVQIQNAALPDVTPGKPPLDE
ncbi:MAG: hypothetical protein ACJ74H_07165 [Thermoanaerobaculia bacterium]